MRRQILTNLHSRKYVGIRGFDVRCFQTWRYFGMFFFPLIPCWNKTRVFWCLFDQVLIFWFAKVPLNPAFTSNQVISALTHLSSTHLSKQTITFTQSIFPSQRFQQQLEHKHKHNSTKSNMINANSTPKSSAPPPNSPTNNLAPTSPSSQPSSPRPPSPPLSSPA